MAARIRHIALCVKDIKATADFYEKAFGLKRTEINEGKTAWSMLHERRRGQSRAAAIQERGRLRRAQGWTGIHHFGFQCDDLPAQQKQIEKAGGKFFFDLGEPEDEGFERKFKDPNGIVFDINWKGWQLTKDKMKNASGGLAAGESACDETRRSGREETSARRPQGTRQDGAARAVGGSPREECHEAASDFACAAGARRHPGAQAQDYPTRPGTVIVPFAAGGPADITGRIVADIFSRALGQQFVVENIGGAGGATGTTRVARASPTATRSASAMSARMPPRSR